jgi:hypothetical protein
VKQTSVDNQNKTEDLIAEIKKGQQQINASLEALFIQLQHIGIDT